MANKVVIPDVTELINIALLHQLVYFLMCHSLSQGGQNATKFLNVYKTLSIPVEHPERLPKFFFGIRELLSHPSRHEREEGGEVDDSSVGRIELFYVIVDLFVRWSVA